MRYLTLLLLCLAAVAEAQTAPAAAPATAPAVAAAPAPPLASVNGPMNAVRLDGNAVGNVMFYGQGAGGAPTASVGAGATFSPARPGFAPPAARVARPWA